MQLPLRTQLWNNIFIVHLFKHFLVCSTLFKSVLALLNTSTANVNEEQGVFTLVKPTIPPAFNVDEDSDSDDDDDGPDFIYYFLSFVSYLLLLGEEEKDILSYLGEGWEDFLSIPEGHYICFAGLAWTTFSDLKQLIRYPEVMQLDFTANTNRYNLPFGYTTGEDASQKAFTWLACIGFSVLLFFYLANVTFTEILPVPVETQRSFLWCFQTVLQIFFGEYLQNVTTVVRFFFSLQMLNFILILLNNSDGDPWLCNVIDSLIQRNIIGAGDCHQLLCFWHTLTLYLSEKCLPNMGSDTLTFDSFI